MYAHIHVESTGRIVGMGASPLATILVQDNGISMHTHWYDWETHTTRLKAMMPIVVTETAILGAPCQCDVNIVGPVNMKAIVDQEDVPVSFDVPGHYTFIFTPSDPRWAETTVELEVPE